MNTPMSTQSQQTSRSGATIGERAADTMAAIANIVAGRQDRVAAPPPAPSLKPGAPTTITASPVAPDRPTPPTMLPTTAPSKPITLQDLQANVKASTDRRHGAVRGLNAALQENLDSASVQRDALTAVVSWHTARHEEQLKEIKRLREEVERLSKANGILAAMPKRTTEATPCPIDSATLGEDLVGLHELTEQYMGLGEDDDEMAAIGLSLDTARTNVLRLYAWLKAREEAVDEDDDEDDEAEEAPAPVAPAPTTPAPMTKEAILAHVATIPAGPARAAYWAKNPEQKRIALGSK